MSVELEIKGHGGKIGIVVLGYEDPMETTGSDANWLTCRVRAGLGPFGGEVGATFTTHDFVRFSQGLRALLEGKQSEAAFETDEQVLEVKFEARPTGATKISGAIRYSSGPSMAL